MKNPRRLLSLRSAALLIVLSMAGGAQQTQWVTLQETQEHAFSVEVPKGWNIVGGVYRFTYLEPRLWVEMKSPHGKTEVRLGDPLAPKTYQVPNPLFARYGATEGVMVPSGMGTRYMLMHYLPGQTYASVYGRLRFSQSCQTLEPKQIRVLPAMFNHLYRPAGKMRAMSSFAAWRMVRNWWPMWWRRRDSLQFRGLDISRTQVFGG